jgi:hypothetical protein
MGKGVGCNFGLPLLGDDNPYRRSLHHLSKQELAHFGLGVKPGQLTSKVSKLLEQVSLR